MWLSIDRERDKQIKRDTDNDAAALAAPVAPQVPPLLMRRLPIAQSRRFSDSSSHLLLLLSFIPSASVSYLAIAVAAAFRKNLVASASSRSARDLQKNDRQTSPRTPRHFSPSSPKNSYIFSGSNIIFLSDKLRKLLYIFKNY